MFTLADQAENCLNLANRLSSIPDYLYDHSWFYEPESGSACALGHAALWGIAGIHLNKSQVPTFDGIDSISKGADNVFGAESYENIFSADNVFSKNDAIQLLHDQAKRLLSSMNKQSNGVCVQLLDINNKVLESYPISNDSTTYATVLCLRHFAKHEYNMDYSDGYIRVMENGAVINKYDLDFK